MNTNKFIQKDIGKNITVRCIILFLIMMSGITFGAQNDGWFLTDKFVQASDPSLLAYPVKGIGLLISPYHNPASGESFIKQLFFKPEQAERINLGGYNQYQEGILDKISLDNNHYYLMEKGDEKAFIQVKGINKNYYQKWDNCAGSLVYEQGDKIDFHIKHNDEEIVQSLYGQADIKQVREYIRKGARFAIKWHNAGNDSIPNAVVTGIEQNCTIYWDGWKPELGGGSDHLGEFVFEKPYEITIDLEKNKKAEARYKQNKIISRGLMMGFAALMVWRFWDYLVALKDAIKAYSSGPRLPSVDAREFFRNNSTGHGVVVK